MSRKVAVLEGSLAVADLAVFNDSAQFLLTEAGHGLDVKNMETTAVLQDDGSFILNTPHPGAAK